ncbi:Core-2/I-Branching enzyme [Dictyocaulus viviparus]|uniref:protein xylosyltransferase n=1 Tax=Dictyocaulus viviparus TaxID=29172 RepID=A0A0D8Y3S7_DICVI|nr:Core-2/I-Branching enzyme [Dictyocaulus viviparus]
MAKYLDELDVNIAAKPPRILFLLQLNGRNERQVKRLLKVLYSPFHYYYIHVDKRQLFLLTEMKAVAAILPNVYVATETHSTIWGGASLLTMIQDAIRRSIAMSSFSDWDYLINLSESDFPVLTLHELEVQLRLNPHKSYMSSHGYNTARFIQKQGFDFVFIECENRMWRIGRRDEFPRNLRVDGGSDWLVLHREFAEYSISDDELAVKLRSLFSSVILPVESFFHTLSYNSRFCQNIIGSNLRLTNWNRKQGCRCESLKSIVDWCGCSPLVFKKEHIEKFSLKNAIAKPYYIARKFDSLIDIDAVALAEQQAMRDRPHLLHSNDIMFNVTFVNHYKADVDGYSIPYSMMAKSLLSMFSDKALFFSLSRIDIVKIHSSAPEQMIFTMQTDFSTLPLQLLVERKMMSDIVLPGIADGFKLEAVVAGLDIDHKEEIFRGVTAYADLRSSPTVALRWSRVAGTSTSVNEASKTSPSVRFLWRGPDLKTVAIQNLDPYDSIRGTQFATLNLQKLNATNIHAGMWSVVVQTDHDESHEVLATVWFPIYSTQDTQLFDSLVREFFTLRDSCSDTCSSTTWSTFHPDPKSDILIGYDKNVKGLI